MQHAKVSVIILNLSPEETIDYVTFNKLIDRTKMTGEWLAFCSACPVPEIANVFKRTSIPFHQITGVLQNDEFAWNEIKEWIDAAQVRSVISYNRLGCVRNYYGGMLDIYTDLTKQYATFNRTG